MNQKHSLISTIGATNQINSWIGRPFLPSDISDLLLWFESIDYLSQDSSNIVNCWVNRKIDYSAIQSIVADQGLLVSNGLGTKDVLRFDGSNDHYDLPNSALPTGYFTILIACKKTANNSAAFILGRAYNLGAIYIQIMADNHVTNPGALRLVVEGISLYSANSVSGSWNLFTLKGASTGMSIRINGSADNSNANNNPVLNYSALDRATIGVFKDTSNNIATPFVGDIACIYSYNRALAAEEITLVENYIKTIYPSLP
jgi:hypothetical protein